MEGTKLTNQICREYVQDYKEGGLLHIAQRQWTFLREPEQYYLYLGSIFVSLGSAGVGSRVGLKLAKNYANSLSLKDDERITVILSGASLGSLVGAVSSLAGQSYAIEHSTSMSNWKEESIGKKVQALLKEEFATDPIWSQFVCPLTKRPMFVPMRTPGGVAYEHGAIEANSNGMVKNSDISPSEFDISRCVEDKEMMVIIYKRLRHLTDAKLSRGELNDSNKLFLFDYQRMLQDLIVPNYIQLRGRIEKSRSKTQERKEASFDEIHNAEIAYEKEMKEFKSLFGESPLYDINWSHCENWGEMMDQRWMSKYQ